MTDRARIAITVAIALLLGASTYGHMYALDLPGVLQSVWGSGEWLVYGLAIIGVFFVYRWWALLPAIVPTVVSIAVLSLTDYEVPWRDEFGLAGDPVIAIVLAPLAISMQVAILALGLLARTIWERIRRGRRGDSIPTPA